MDKEVFTDITTLSMYFLAKLNTSKTFFSHLINEWNKLDPNICSFSNYYIFCDAMLKIKRPVEREIFSINDPIGIKMLTILRLHFSHLCEHKFRYGFKHTLKPPCSCSIEAKTTTQYFLRFHLYNSNQATLVNDLSCG